MDCEVCAILADTDERGRSRKIIDGQYWIVSLRADQEYLGTCFITAKRHVRSLPDLKPEEEEELIILRNAIIMAQERAFGPSVVNVSCLMNDAFQKGSSGQTHVHWHLKPRYAFPVDFEGERFEDHEFGHYIRQKHPHEVSPEVQQAIIAALKAEMQ